MEKLDLPKALDNLFTDNNDNSYTYAYTDKNYLDFGASTTELNINLIKSGTGSLSVTSLGADNASGLSYSGSDFGTYTILIDRTSLPNGQFSNTIYFNLSDGSSVSVPIYYSVGAARNRANLGKVEVQLRDTSNNMIASGILDMDGSVNFTGSNIPNGNYYLITSTNIDDDGFICSCGELCEYYPELASSDGYFTIDGSDVSGYEIFVSPLWRFGGPQSLSSNASTKQSNEYEQSDSSKNENGVIRSLGKSNKSRVIRGDKDFINN